MEQIHAVYHLINTASAHQHPRHGCHRRMHYDDHLCVRIPFIPQAVCQDQEYPFQESRITFMIITSLQGGKSGASFFPAMISL
jgi:hypothetical protein